MVTAVIPSRLRDDAACTDWGAPETRKRTERPAAAIPVRHIASSLAPIPRDGHLLQGHPGRPSAGLGEYGGRGWRRSARGVAVPPARPRPEWSEAPRRCLADDDLTLQQPDDRFRFTHPPRRFGCVRTVSGARPLSTAALRVRCLSRHWAGQPPLMGPTVPRPRGSGGWP